MIRKSTTTLLALLVALALLAACGQTTSVAPTAASGDDPMTGMSHDAMGAEDEMAALGEMTGEPFGAAFLDMMIPHHQSAIEMAQLVLERSERPELRAAAQEIITTQSAEIAQMTTWLQEWYGQTPSGEDHGMAMAAEMEALRATPAAAFDVAFLEMMIEHHEGAIEMAQLVSTRTERPELRAAAEAIIAAQERENAQFEQWIAAWGAGE